MAKSAVGVCPQTGAAAGNAFPARTASERVFSNHGPAPAGLTNSAPPGDDFETAAVEPVHPLAWAGDGDYGRFGQPGVALSTGG